MKVGVIYGLWQFRRISGCASASTCGSAQQQPQDLTAKLNEFSSVKHVIGVVSGKEAA